MKAFGTLLLLGSLCYVTSSPSTALDGLLRTGRRLERLQTVTLTCLNTIKTPIDINQDQIHKITDMSRSLTSIKTRMATLMKQLPLLKQVTSAATLFVDGLMTSLNLLKGPVDQVEPMMKQIGAKVVTWPAVYRQVFSNINSLPQQVAQVTQQIQKVYKQVPVGQNTAACLAALGPSQTKLNLQNALENMANTLNAHMMAQESDTKDTYNACNGMRGVLAQFKTIYDSPGVGDISGALFKTSMELSKVERQLQQVFGHLTTDLVCEAELSPRPATNRCASIQALLTDSVYIGLEMKKLAESKANALMSSLTAKIPAVPGLNNYLRMYPLLTFSTLVQGVSMAQLPNRFQFSGTNFNRAIGLNP